MTDDRREAMQQRADELARWYLERGQTPRSWLCALCCDDVDSLDLERHLRERHGLLPQPLVADGD